MDELLKAKMQHLMYRLTKEAARYSFVEFLESCDISEDEYDQIKDAWLEHFGVVPYV